MQRKTAICSAVPNNGIHKHKFILFSPSLWSQWQNRNCYLFETEKNLSFIYMLRIVAEFV